MSKRWKLKTNSSNILLVLITLILIKAEWVSCTNDTLSGIIDSESTGRTRVYIGNDEIAHYFFQLPANGSSLVLDGVQNCLDSFQLMTCIKMLLLSRINEVDKYLEEPDVVEKDLHLLNGFMVFKRKNETRSVGLNENRDVSSLDEEIAFKVLKIFRNRFLLVNLLPKFKVEVEPKLETNDTDFICFTYKVQKGSGAGDGMNDNVIEGRGRKKSGGMGMMMLIPPMIMLGLMPFTLASLKAMVMNAVMINMMALNGAIFMTIRNLVFGPRQGGNVKYVNYGYSKDRQTQSKKPVLIIHSPAAFVKQPPVKTKHFNREPVQLHRKPNHEAGNYFLTDDSSLFNHQHGENVGSKDYYLIQQDYGDDDSNYEQHNRRRIQRREQGNTFERFNSSGKLKSRTTSKSGFKNPFPTFTKEKLQSRK